LSDEGKAPKAELKPLPLSLRYDFLELKYTYPMIVNASLNASRIDSLLRSLRKHCKDVGYTLDDLKGIYPSLCMH